MNMVNVSFDDVINFVDVICAKLKQYKFTGVYGLPKGGLVLATLVANKLNIPLLMAPYDNCIIIDDICDSGESLLHYVKHTSENSNENHNYTIITMFYNPNGIYNITPNYYGHIKEDDWIVFPWEL